MIEVIRRHMYTLLLALILLFSTPYCHSFHLCYTRGAPINHPRRPGIPPFHEHREARTTPSHIPPCSSIQPQHPYSTQLRQQQQLRQQRFALTCCCLASSTPGTLAWPTTQQGARNMVTSRSSYNSQQQQLHRYSTRYKATQSKANRFVLLVEQSNSDAVQLDYVLNRSACLSHKTLVKLV
jgi:hypothetical protein